MQSINRMAAFQRFNRSIPEYESAQDAEGCWDSSDLMIRFDGKHHCRVAAAAAAAVVVVVAVVAAVDYSVEIVPIQIAAIDFANAKNKYEMNNSIYSYICVNYLISGR